MGDKLGRILGFPTANLEIDTAYKLIPADGIYAVTLTTVINVLRECYTLGTGPLFTE